MIIVHTVKAQGFENTYVWPRDNICDPSPAPFVTQACQAVGVLEPPQSHGNGLLELPQALLVGVLQKMQAEHSPVTHVTSHVTEDVAPS